MYVYLCMFATLSFSLSTQKWLKLLYERNKEKRECVCEGEERKNVWVSVRMTKVL